MWGYKKGCGFIEEMCYGDEEFPEFCKNINSVHNYIIRSGVHMIEEELLYVQIEIL